MARVTGRWHLERLAAIEEKVGSFGRAEREALAAQRRQLDELGEAVRARAGAAAVEDLGRRLERVERLIEHQERTFSAALERAGVLDDQGAGDRRFGRRIDELLRHTRPVIVGPWTGEVGFELIYWIPFVRSVVKTYRIPADRLLVVSRGGTASWYGGIAERYADAFDFVSPDEFRVATAEARKQRRVGSFDAELIERVSDAHRLRRPDLLHPGMMYRLLMPFWKGLASMARVEKYAEYDRLKPAPGSEVRELPSDYVAARFYFSECFPDTPGNREFVRSLVDGISRQTTVVLLNTPFQVDDHHDADLRGGRVMTIGSQMSPSRNLATQTAVISRARAFVGTYGGYAYLAPLCGVDALAFYSEPTFQAQHLHVAQHVFRKLGGPTLVPLDVRTLPAMRLAMSGSLVETS
jgi:multidrug efflux pump subunit AcrA (membrane-fusion protein)